MTFFVAPAQLAMPGAEWFAGMYAARRDLDTLCDEVHAGNPRRVELCHRLEQMDEVTLHDMQGIVVADSKLSFMHYNLDTRTLLLAVMIDMKQPDGTFATDFDRLFLGQYDPEVTRFHHGDTPYVIAKLDAQLRVSGNVTVIQPYQEITPDGISVTTIMPPEFIQQLTELAA